MSKLMKTIYDCATGETIEREMTAIEITQYKADQAEALKFAADNAAQAGAKAALLNRLGITADEAKLLLS